MIKRVDHAGLISGSTIDKTTLFKYFYEENGNTPIIEECSVNILCKTISVTEIHNQLMFVTDVVNTYVSEKCCTNGYADTQKINPIMYTMDNQYWGLGDHIGTGFEAGKELLK